MFTGIVEIIGSFANSAVTALLPLDQTNSGGSGTSLTISNARAILGDAHLGDSISVNGTCLTVTSLPADPGNSNKKDVAGGDSFKVGIAPETLRRTNLGNLKEGSRVNLERALLPETRLGGHFLQGHVDTVATIVKKVPDGNAITFRMQPRDQAVLRYIVEKGFIALDGTSLTITAVSDAASDAANQGWFEIMLIAYSQERVIMAGKDVGAEVNVEVDMVGKYVEKSVAGYFTASGSDGAPGGQAGLEKLVERLVDARLRQSKQL